MGLAIDNLRIGMRVSHPRYGVGVVKALTQHTADVTFDDAPVGAARVDAHMLEQYGARGTFYIAGGLVDAWSGNWTGTSASADDIVDFTAGVMKSPATPSRTRARRTCYRRGLC